MNQWKVFVRIEPTRSLLNWVNGNWVIPDFIYSCNTNLKNVSTHMWLALKRNWITWPKLAMTIFYHSDNNFPSWSRFKNQNLQEVILIFRCICNYQPLHRCRVWHKVNFKRSLIDSKSEFSFSLIGCRTKVKLPNLPYYFPIGGDRIFRYIIARCEMQAA